jgi:hypothetical protein
MRRSTSFSRFSLAALLVALAFNLNSGCGASDADKDKTLEEMSAQLNNCSDRLRMGNEKIVSMQAQLTQCKADNTALQSKVDKATTEQQTKMAALFLPKDTRTWRCMSPPPNEATIDGTFGDPEFIAGVLVMGFTDIRESKPSRWCPPPRLVDLTKEGFSCRVNGTSYVFTCSLKE